jgi:hypothetical protein
MSTMATRNIPLAQLYPASDGPVALNVCGDPDCGNFGVKPDFSLGRASKKTKRGAKPQSNAAAIWLGRYALRGASTEKNDKRTSFVAGLLPEPLHWSDHRVMRCQHDRNGKECGDGFAVLSDDHLSDEIESYG